LENRQQTTLWLVRHGQTDWNVEGRYQGHADIPLNETGLSQARKLAEQLTGRSFQAIFSSDLIRARVTAEILGQALHLPVQVEPRLREVDQGDWEGMLFKDIAVRYAAEMALRKEDPAGARPPNGESLAELADRIAAAASSIAVAYPESDVLVVSHGLSIATLLAQARGIPITEAYSLIPENTHPEKITWPVIEKQEIQVK
jgi:alpha-ribazole phosphatase